MKKILFLTKNLSSNFHRLELPFGQLKNFEPASTFGDADIVVFNRFPYGYSIEEVLAARKKYKFKIWLDIDDYWRHPILPLKFFKGFQIETLMKSADVITTTNEVLASRARLLNNNTLVVPNALPFDQGQFSLRPEDFRHEHIHFIISSSSSNWQNTTLLRNLPDTDVPLLVAGYSPGDKYFKKMFKTIDIATKKALPLKNFSNYMEVYDEADCLVVPMLSTAHNAAKSNLKTLEAGCKGLAMIASKTLPYYQPADEKFIDFASCKSDWVALLNYYKNNKNYVYEKGNLLAEHVRKNYHLNKVNEIRAQIIESL